MNTSQVIICQVKVPRPFDGQILLNARYTVGLFPVLLRSTFSPAFRFVCYYLADLAKIYVRKSCFSDFLQALYINL